MTTVRPIAVLALVLVSMMLYGGVAVYAEPNGDGNGNTVAVGGAGSSGTAGYNSNGISAGASSQQTLPTAGGTGGGGSAGGGGSPVYYQPVPNNNPGSGPTQVGGNGTVFNAPGSAGGTCPPGQTAYETYDANGAALGLVCAGNQANQPGAPQPSPLRLAEQASAQEPWPNLSVGINPDRGLTGLASWFWLSGNPNMPDVSASAGDLTVTVHASLADVEWSFGDGQGSAGGVGRPYPAESDVQHVYQTDSLDRPKGFSVTASTRYEVFYSVNGGPFAELGFKSNGYSRAYVVNQLQPQAVETR